MSDPADKSPLVIELYEITSSLSVTVITMYDPEKTPYLARRVFAMNVASGTIPKVRMELANEIYWE